VIRALLSVALTALALATATVRAAEGPVRLPDSTFVERFTLPNGLRVVLRHIPGCSRIATTTAFAFGQSSDPAGLEGRAQLLAELHYLAATGDSPARTREEMTSLRPQGWNFAVSPGVSWFEELASIDQFPGVLHQIAGRLRALTIEASDLASAKASASADLASRYESQPALALHYRSGALSQGRSDAQVARYASGRGLEGVTLPKAREALKQLYVPANASLSIAGDLSRFPARKIVEDQFGDIPGGTALTTGIPGAADTASRVLRRPELARALGVFGVRAPALTDSLHPDFLIATLMLGGQAAQTFGGPEAPLTTRFQYNVFDDPTLVRFYPELDEGARSDRDLDAAMQQLFIDFRARTITGDLKRALWRGVDWLLGGPVPPEMMPRVLQDLGTLHTVCLTAAIRELWGGEAFWAGYRARFRSTAGPDQPYWIAWFRSPQNAVRVVLVPDRR
jgi:hypothetical protein